MASARIPSRVPMSTPRDPHPQTCGHHFSIGNLSGGILCFSPSLTGTREFRAEQLCRQHEHPAHLVAGKRHALGANGLEDFEREQVVVLMARLKRRNAVRHLVHRDPHRPEVHTARQCAARSMSNEATKEGREWESGNACPRYADDGEHELAIMQTGSSS